MAFHLDAPGLTPRCSLPLFLHFSLLITPWLWDGISLQLSWRNPWLEWGQVVAAGSEWLFQSSGLCCLKAPWLCHLLTAGCCGVMEVGMKMAQPLEDVGQCWGSQWGGGYPHETCSPTPGAGPDLSPYPSEVHLQLSAICLGGGGW